jgi:hypothetical protein
MPEIFSLEHEVRNEIEPIEIAVKRVLTRDFFEGLKLIG